MSDITNDTGANAQENILAVSPWTSTCFGERAEIDVYDASADAWETIATVLPLNGIDAEDVASFIVRAVSYYQKSMQAHDAR